LIAMHIHGQRFEMQGRTTPMFKELGTAIQEERVRCNHVFCSTATLIVSNCHSVTYHQMMVSTLKPVRTSPPNQHQFCGPE
jgi:hypothetical protein